MNIVEKIFSEADRQAIALVSEGEEVTYGRLIEMAETAAARIASSPAARVGLDCPNGIAHVVLALAIVRTGKCLVPLASELSSRERLAARNLLSRPPHRKRSERGRVPGSEGV